MSLQKRRLPVRKLKNRIRRKQLRKSRPRKTSLTEAVRRVLVRVALNPQPFGVFSLHGRLAMAGSEGKRFVSLTKRWPDSFIGNYDRSVKVENLLDDLQDFFSDAE